MYRFFRKWRNTHLSAPKSGIFTLARCRFLSQFYGVAQHETDLITSITPKK
jgi:hypothetical protein